MKEKVWCSLQQVICLPASLPLSWSEVVESPLASSLVTQFQFAGLMRQSPSIAVTVDRGLPHCRCKTSRKTQFGFLMRGSEFLSFRLLRSWSREWSTFFNSASNLWWLSIAANAIWTFFRHGSRVERHLPISISLIISLRVVRDETFLGGGH